MEAATSTAASSARRPRPRGTSRLYLSGDGAAEVAALFAGTSLEPAVVDGDVGAASALKMAYAAWTKGTAALLLAADETARAEGVEAALHAEWTRSQPELAGRLEHARRNATTKGWRWIAEMEEIAVTFAAAGQPDGFHRAGCRRLPAMVRGAAGRGGGDRRARHRRRDDG